MGDDIAPPAVEAAFNHLAGAIHARCAGTEYFLVGIANGGIALASQLAEQLPDHPEVGVLNALFHRDDVGRKPILGDFQPTNLPFVVDDARIVLVDDVFDSGRTVRAALNELFDHGRPLEVLLATLVNTGRPRLPIRPDFVGLELDPGPGHKVVVAADPAFPAHFSISLEPK